MKEIEQESLDKSIKKNRKLYFFDIALVIIILIGILIYLFKVEGIENMSTVLQSVDYRWVALGLVCLVVMWTCEAITLHFPLKDIYKDLKFKSSFRATMIGQLFNNLTPFASGGQVMQAYKLSKEGRRASDSVSVLVAKFVITQTSLILFTIIVVLTQFNFFMGIFKDLVWIGVIGIVINIVIVIMFFLAGVKKNWVLKVSKKLISFFGKIHIGKFRFIKNPEKRLDKIEESVENFSSQFIKLKEHKKTIAIMAIVGTIQNLLYYTITYMVYRAFGNSGTGFFQIVTAQAFLMLIMTIFPTPGAGVGAEGGFLLLFKSIFQNGTISLSILFWRIYIFYLPILVGAFFMIPSKLERELRQKEQ